MIQNENANTDEVKAVYSETEKTFKDCESPCSGSRHL